MGSGSGWSGIGDIRSEAEQIYGNFAVELALKIQAS
jgi:hypothetical protein